MSYFTKVFAPLATVSLCLAVMLPTPPIAASNSKDIEFLGEVTFPTGTKFKGTEVGGLSGITYDSSKNVYYSISDDRSQKASARFYTLKINLSQGTLNKVDLLNVTALHKPDGKPFEPLSLDPEGIALTRGKLFISSEGDTDGLINPFINQFSLTGKQLLKLPIPQGFLPTAAKNNGIRNNLAFESLTITPSQKYLFTATENAFYQDGETATVEAGSPSRILKYNLITKEPEQEFLYFTDPVTGTPYTPKKLSNNGLADLLAIDNNHFLSLERSFSFIKGNTIKLYKVSLAGADNIRKIKSLKAANINKIKPVQKKLLLNLNQLNINLDNIEGLTFGPCLPDGRRSLILISDNNFNSAQLTQILAFSVKSACLEKNSEYRIQN
jgi:3-phytase